MNKREMIHTLVGRLLDLEENSEKGVAFNYSTYNDLFSFHATSTPEHYTDWLCDSFYLSFDQERDPSKVFTSALCEVERIKNLAPSEPKVRITLTEEKARELGLIA